MKLFRRLMRFALLLLVAAVIATTAAYQLVLKQEADKIDKLKGKRPPPTAEEIARSNEWRVKLEADQKAYVQSFQTPLEQQKRIGSMVFSLDGRTLITTHTEKTESKEADKNGVVRIVSNTTYHRTMWDVATGTAIKRWVTDFVGADLRIAPDGIHLGDITHSSFYGNLPGRMLIHNLESDQRLEIPIPPTSYTPQIAFTADGRYLIGSTWRGIDIFDRHTGEFRQEATHDGSASAVDCHPFDANLFAVGTTGSVQIWDVRSQQVLEAFPFDGAPHMVRFSRDATRLIAVSGYGQSAVWDTNNWNLLASTKTQKLSQTLIDVSADGKWWAARMHAAPDDIRVCRFYRTGDPNAQIVNASPPEKAWPKCMKFSPQGILFVSFEDYGICFVDPESMQRISFEEMARRLPPAQSRQAVKPAETITNEQQQLEHTTRVISSTVQIDETISTDSFSQIGKADKHSVLAVVPLEHIGKSISRRLLGKAISQMLANDLSGRQTLTIVERNDVQSILSENDLKHRGFAEGGPDSVTAATTAGWIFEGSYACDSEILEMNVTLSKVAQKAIAATWKCTGKFDEMLLMETKLSQRIAELLGASDNRKEETVALKSDATVAVLAFQNLGEKAEQDVLQLGLAELLQVQLSLIDGIRLVEREQLDRLFEEQKLSLAGLTDNNQAIQAGKVLEAERIILGGFLQTGDSLRLQTRIVDATSGEVVAAQQVQSSANDFGAMLESLTLDIARDLSLKANIETRRELWNSIPLRRLESAIHYTRGRRQMLEGNVIQAAHSFEQALLIESDNVYLHAERVQAYTKAKQFPDAAMAAEEALSHRFNLGQKLLKESVYRCLLDAYSELGKNEEHNAVAEKMKTEFGRKVRHANVYEDALALAKTGKTDEALAKFKEIVGSETHKKSRMYPDALVQLYLLQRKKLRTMPLPEREDGSLPPEVDEQIKLIYTILDMLPSRPLQEFRLIHTLAPSSIQLYNRRGRELVPLIPDDTYIQILRKILDMPNYWYLFRGTRHYLAEALRKAKRYDESINEFQTLIGEDPPHNNDGLPVAYDLNYYVGSYGQGLDPERQYLWVTLIQVYLEKQDIKGAIKQCNMFLNKYGRNSPLSDEVVRVLFKHKEAVSDIEKGALLWGGGSDGRKAWEPILAKRGYTLHPQWRPHITLADLTPYELVILARSGSKPFLPSENLALRSYVATGGTLLIVVSPGWEPAATGIHNGLLSLFDMQAGEKPVVRATATWFADHPITREINYAMAKTAVDLQVPEDTALIKSDDRTILAASPFGKGRVVVASFGQWFLPSAVHVYPSGHWWLRRSRVHWTASLPQSELPFEVGRGECADLLDNVVTWLDESQSTSEDLQYRQQMRAFHEVVRDVAIQLQPWQSMKPAAEKLISNAGSGFWKQELLFAAGEAFQQLTVSPMVNYQKFPKYMFPPGTDGSAERSFYDDFLRESANHPLRPYAQWRLAECGRRKVVFGLLEKGELGEIEEALEEYSAVQSQPGDYVWAWSLLRQGELLFSKRDYAKAAKCFEEVAETMVQGPEKVIALSSLGICKHWLGEVAEARRHYQALGGMPDLVWYGQLEPNANWGPRVEWIYKERISTREVAKRLIESLDEQAKKDK